jgi:hypothetical protein
MDFLHNLNLRDKRNILSSIAAGTLVIKLINICI